MKIAHTLPVIALLVAVLLPVATEAAGESPQQTIKGTIVSVDDQKGDIVLKTDSGKTIKVCDVYHYFGQVSEYLQVSVPDADFAARLKNFSEFKKGDQVEITYRSGQTELDTIKRISPQGGQTSAAVAQESTTNEPSTGSGRGEDAFATKLTGILTDMGYKDLHRLSEFPSQYCGLIQVVGVESDNVVHTIDPPKDFGRIDATSHSIGAKGKETTATLDVVFSGYDGNKKSTCYVAASGLSKVLLFIWPFPEERRHLADFRLGVYGVGSGEWNEVLCRLKIVDLPQVVEAIETTIAVSVNPFSFGPITLSEKLKQLTKKYEVENVFGAAVKGYAAENKAKGVAILLKEDWGMPFAFKSAKLPVVKFRKGEIGIDDSDIYVKEGTEALVGDKVYVYQGKQWRPVAKATPPKQTE